MTRCEVLAKLLKPIMIQLDFIRMEFPVKELEKMFGTMDQKAKVLQALPLPHTQNKAQLMIIKNRLFKKIIESIKAREEIAEYKNPWLDESMIDRLLND